MIRINRFFLAIAFIATFVSTSYGQSTINSPYSKFGVGNLKGSYLPQNKAMGNLGQGISTVGVYQNINIANPASYSQLRLTTFDVGLAASVTSLNRDGQSSNSFNGTMSHLAIAVPVSKKSALSFGLIPYSDMGYNYKTESLSDTFLVDHVYKGEGGLNRAYIGYGFGIGKNFNFGFNASYLFGNLKQSRAVEFTDYVGFLNTKTEANNSLGGWNLEFGTQYVGNLSDKMKLTLGYTGTLKTNITNNNNVLSSRYVISGESESRVDTVSFLPDNSEKMNIPASHSFGFSIQKTNKWLIGADFRMSDWSDFKLNNTSQNLNKSWGTSVGFQIIPNINSVTNYLNVIDYRIGVNYDKTYLTVNRNEIDVKSINFGLGFPLVASTNRSAFYKINFTTEIGTRGAVKQGLVKENFYNFHLGFTINDRWFQKYKYD